MTTDAATAELMVDAPTAPAGLSAAVRWKIFLYLGALLILMGFGSPHGGLIGLPISFILKNKLHLAASQLALFGLVASAPTYVAFLFGFARDTFNPFGMKDRGFIVLFGSICALIYVFFAFAPITYLTLLSAVLLVGISFLFVLSSERGLISTIGQQQ